MNRSTAPETRNPVLALASANDIAGLPDDARDALVKVLRDISKDARERAEKSWSSHKAPMAAYWKAVAVYSRHMAIAAQKGRS